MFGTAAVVLIHSLPPTPTVLQADLGWYSVANTVTRWCVPVFFMLSGALLLAPGLHESAGRFYRRRAWRIGLPVAV